MSSKCDEIDDDDDSQDDNEEDDDLYDDLDLDTFQKMSSSSDRPNESLAASIKQGNDSFDADLSLTTASLPLSLSISDTRLPPPVATNSLTAHVEALTATVAQLSTENETLKRNMGILFRTARAEIARKDHEIHLLQAELDESHKRARPKEQGKRDTT